MREYWWVLCCDVTSRINFSFSKTKKLDWKETKHTERNEGGSYVEWAFACANLHMRH